MTTQDRTREEAIRDLYQDLLGREADEEGLQHYLTNYQWDLDVIERHIQASDEYYKRHNAPLFNVGIGRDAGRDRQNQYFDSADYIQALTIGGPLNLERTRNEVLDWLRDAAAGQRWLRPQNRPGVVNPDMPGGINLFDRIEGAGSPNRDINTSWGDYASKPDAGQYFGHGDLAATRALSFRDEEIKSVLDQNMEWLRDKNLPVDQGGDISGVYNMLEVTPEDDPYVQDRPKVTRQPSRFDETISRNTIERPSRDRLTINPGEATVGKRQRSGATRAKAVRPKYRQTTDLAREARNSLNIS